MSRKILSTKEFMKGFKAMSQLPTESAPSQSGPLPNFIKKDGLTYHIPESENRNLDEIFGQTNSYFSQLNEVDSHKSFPFICESALYGEIMDGVFNNPNFSWDCNPAAADLEIMNGEMLRKQLQLHDEFSYSNGGMGKLCLNLNDALLLCLQESRVSLVHSSDYEIGDDTLVYGIDKIDQFKPLNLFEID